MRKIRILYTINNLKTAGMNRVVSDLARNLDKALFMPTVAVGIKIGSDTERDIERTCNIIELPLRIPTRPRYRFPASVLGAAAKLRGAWDIVHSFDYSSDWQEGAAVKLAGVKWVAEKTNFNWGGARWRLRAFFASKIICLSDIQRKEVFGKTPFERKAEVVYTGVDLNLFSPAGPDLKRTKRTEMKIPQEAFVISCIADLIPVKGHKELFEAFAGLKGKTGKEVYLLLAGGSDPDHAGYLKKLSGTLGISKHVKYLGRRNDVPDILKMSDGFVLPTRAWGRKEALGAALIEAMASGLPVIATRSGGPEEVVVDGETGWLVSPEGSGPLAEALAEMAADLQKCRTFGDAGRERAEALFSLKAMTEKYQRIYLGLVKA